MDFVLTFEELAGIIEAKDIDVADLEVDPTEQDLVYASAAGRGFAQSGGVAKAVADKIKEWHPDMDVKIASAQGLAECKKLLMLAKAGKYNGYLLEGMGCPGGCVNGGGQPIQHAVVRNFVDLRARRAAALYEADKDMPLRKSHESEAVKRLYAEFLGEPGSHKAHEVLHTSYVARPKYK